MAAALAFVVCARHELNTETVARTGTMNLISGVITLTIT
jgi:hypothetical protein